MSKRRASLFVCISFIVWGIVERLLGFEIGDQVFLALVFGLITVFSKD